MHDSISTGEEESIKPTEHDDEGSKSSTKVQPRVDPKTADFHPFWKSPFTSKQSDLKSKPNVIHVIENKEDLNSRFHHLMGNFYVPLTKCHVFRPHWLQKLLDTEMKFYLHPMNGHNAVASAHYEGLDLLRKLRYILAKFEWNSAEPIKLKLSMAENHGNLVFHKKRRLRPIYSHAVYVDHSTSSVLFKGPEFLLTLTQPFPADMERSTGDPGGKVDVGLYTRELDTAPEVRARWFISLERRYLEIVDNQPMETLL